MKAENPHEHWDSGLCAACAACAYRRSLGEFGATERGSEELRLRDDGAEATNPLAYAYPGDCQSQRTSSGQGVCLQDFGCSKSRSAWIGDFRPRILRICLLRAELGW